MKANKLLSRRSFLRACITYFVLCSLLVFLINALANALIAARLDRAFPSIDTLLQYEDALAEDDFSAIPYRRLQGCAFLVFDGDDQLLYASDNKLKEYIRAEDLWMINAADGNLYYSVSQMIDQSGNTAYYIALYYYREDTGMTEFIDYCIVDTDYTIREGDLFPGIDRLTERQFELLQGIYRSEWDIVKYEYATTGGEPRTLVFVSPLLTGESYLDTLDDTNRLWLLSVPVLLLAIFLLALLFSRSIRRSIRPLNEAIVAYAQGRRVEVEPSRLPLEFQYVTDSFTRLLDQLEQARVEKEHADKQKQRVIADLSHDLKTPLTVIQGYAQALADGVVPENKQKRYLETICSKAAASTELMDTLFAYARLDHPDYALQPEQIDLCELVKSYLAGKYTELENAGFALEPDLPDHAVPCQADPRLLRRLFENLTGNALKYNPRGTTLLFSLREAPDALFLTIADNGVGIPPAIADTLFEPFVIGNQARTTGCGTGLGMAIVKRIVELHHGTIRLVLPPREGYQTEFEIMLPRQLPDG